MTFPGYYARPDEIYAYTYDADIFCVECTQKNFQGNPKDPDQHGISETAIDREGNTIYRCFYDSDLEYEDEDGRIFSYTCGDCLAPLTEARKDHRHEGDDF
mgnify:CR=1 FL=1